MTDLVNELSTSIEPSITQRLVNHYRVVHTSYRLGDYVSVGIAAGKFVEAVIESIQYLHSSTKPSPKGIRFDTEFNRLLSLPKETIEEEDLTLIIPVVAKMIYTLRSKRQVAHNRGQEIDFLDCCLIVQACDWIIAELLWLNHSMPDNEALDLMTRILQLNLPLVEIINEELVISNPNLSSLEALLALLYRSGGKSPQKDILKALKRRFNQSTCYNAIKIGLSKCLIHRDETDDLHLLQEGKQVITKVISDKILQS